MLRHWSQLTLICQLTSEDMKLCFISINDLSFFFIIHYLLRRWHYIQRTDMVMNLILQSSSRFLVLRTKSIKRKIIHLKSPRPRDRFAVQSLRSVERRNPRAQNKTFDSKRQYTTFNVNFSVSIRQQLTPENVDLFISQF